LPKKPSLLLIGTNRPGANALHVGQLVKDLYAKAGEPLDSYSLHQLPPEIFHPASYQTKPAAFMEVQQRIVEAKGLHIITPEYNGSFPGILKYFIDMLKFAESVERKPVAFVGEAAGQWGALRAVEQLQQVFGYRNAFIFPERVFIPRVYEKFDASGKFNDPEIHQKLEEQVTRFIDFASRLQHPGFGKERCNGQEREVLVAATASR
jgi:NAD(P)H-dependent FMN reductase